MNGSVEALVVSGSDLYAGGSFTSAGSRAANNIAKWDGSSWLPLDQGIGGPVWALAVSGSNVYAGGSFTTASGITVNNVAKWNGNSWSALGSGMNNSVWALAVSGSDLYAGGGFTTAGGTAANYGAKWNGSSWSALGPGVNSAVFALAVSGSDLYAGGYFATASGITVNNIAKWNGSSWSALGARANCPDRPVMALAILGTDLYAGGGFTTAGGIAAKAIAKWSGSGWSALGGGVNGTVSALAVSDSDLYAGGNFTAAGSIPATNIAKWNGSSWSALSGGMNGSVEALVVSGSDLYAGGYFTVSGSIPANCIAKWNGNVWSALGSGMDQAVRALVVSEAELYAGGNFLWAGTVKANRIAKWSGNSWSALGSGMNNSVWALAVSGTNLYVGGDFTTAGGIPARYIAKWNGSSWSALGPGVNSAVCALALLGGDLYAGGGFTYAGGIPANYIAKWNGSSWSALGSGVNAPVHALAVADIDLYAAGYFTSAGGKVSTYVAQAALLGTNLNQPPVITGQPQSLANFVGSTASFTVTAIGSRPLAYQWRFNNTNLAGAANSNLTLVNVQVTNAGNYDVVVTNAFGSVTSAIAALTVYGRECRGSVSVTLSPAESVAAGAQWSVDGGAWMNSGQTAKDVPAGTRRVEFKPVVGWKAPTPFNVRVIGDRLVAAESCYSPLPTMNVGEIPSQRVYENTPAEFRVRCDRLPGATLSLTADSPPAGSLGFDPITGLFRYTPASSDKRSFILAFTATLGTNRVVQQVSVQPVPGLPPERAVFGLTPRNPLPDPESKDYVCVNTILNATPELFNNLSRTTRVVTVSGKTVVLAQGHANGLFDTYNNSADIKAMEIHAETLIVRDTFKLPQTDISIYARDLRFEGAMACIDSTPQSLTTRPAQFANGMHGLKAGNILVQAEHYTSDPLGPTRFILNGGNGQPGGLGQDGGTGISRTPVGPHGSLPWPDNTTAFCLELLAFGLKSYSPSQAVYDSPTAWKPGNGGDASPGGKPGNGGSGGTFSATFELREEVLSGGGIAGAGCTNIGGPPGNPRPAYKVYTTGNYDYSIVSSFTSQRGFDSNSPPPDTVVGPVGPVTTVGHSLTWVSPFALRKILTHAKDAYLNGHLHATDMILTEYEAILTNYTASVEWPQLAENWQFEFSEMLLEIQTLRHRIGSHLDYFANPAGWVPMLSFEANKAVFEAEIERAIRVMYLAYWIGNASASLQGRVNALTSSRQNLVAEVADFKALYTQATDLIPVLQVESINIATEEQQRLADLQWLEQQLLASAEGNVEQKHEVPDWKKALSVASILCKASPVYQPAAGSVGMGLDILVKYDSDKPMETATELSSIAQRFNSSAFKQSADNWRTNVDKIELSTIGTNGLKSYRDYAKRMGEFAKPLAGAIGDIKQVLRETEMPQNEVEAELKKLKADSPRFQEVVGRIEELARRKEQYARELNTAMQAVTKLAADITHDLLAVDALNRGVAEANRVLDPRATDYLKEMDRRARERLLKYHYYMAKAYEYRLLKPYPGELNLTALFDRMAALAAINATHELTAADFDSLKAIYEEQLSSIAGGIFDDYNQNRPELSAPVRFNLTSQELAQLNAGKPVTINMHEIGLFPLSEENIRIVSWKVQSIHTHLAGGGLNRWAFLDLYMEHSGISTLAHNGEYYLFRHYNESTTQPIVWGARYDAFDGSVAPIGPSAASESLLRSLLSIAGIAQTSENILLYSRPSAWADIVLTKSVYSYNAVDILIDSLRLELQYNFVRKLADQAGLEAGALDSDLKPYFVLSTADLNARQDALGDFNRTYHKNAAVSISAPPEYGDWRFAAWTDMFGVPIAGSAATNPAILLLLSDNKVLRAKYLYSNTNDVDADTIDDAWEHLYFGSITNSDMTTDHDGDGIPDAQEYWNGTNPLWADSDGDGLSDWQEFIAGTSGMDAASRLLIRSRLDGLAPGNLILSWDSVQDRLYRVYFSDGLFRNWTNVYEVLGNGNQKSYTNRWSGAPQGLFRLGVDLPLGR
jgi:hypothetical protein